MSDLAAFVDKSCRTGGALILVGEAGLGKSALLEVATDQARLVGARTATLIGTEFRARAPFAALTQLMVPLLGEPGVLSADQERALAVAFGTTTGAPPSQLLVSTSALNVVRQVAEAGPLLIVVDDVHWLDDASARVLAFIARRLHGSSVGVLGAGRPGAGSLTSATAGIPIRYLAGLDDHAARTLLAARLPDLAADVVERTVAAAEGNPLALLQIPLALADEQRASPHALPQLLPMTDRLRAIYEVRLHDLPEETRYMLLLLALDDSGDLRMLQRATGLKPLEALRPAQRAGLLTLHPYTSRAAFSHPLVRSAVAAAASHENRRHAHRLLADAAQDGLERRAWHLAFAADGPDSAAASALADASVKALQRGDASAAQAAMERAVALSTTAAERARRLAGCAVIAADSDATPGTLLRLVAAAIRSDPTADASLEAQNVYAYMALNQGELTSAYRALIDVLHRGAATSDTESINRVLATLQMVCRFAGSPEMWSAFHRAVNSQDGRASLPLRLMAELGLHGSTPPAAVVAELDAAIDRLAEEPDPLIVVQVAAAAIVVDRGAGCQGPLRRVVSDAGTVASAVVASYVLAEIDLATGDLAEAYKVATDGLTVCASVDHVPYAMSLRSVLAMLAAMRGDRAALDAVTNPMARWATAAASRTILDAVHRTRAIEALGRSDHDEAYRQFSALAGADGVGSLPDRHPRALFDLIEAAVGSGHQETVRLLAAGIVARPPSPSNRWNMIAAGARALVDQDDPAGIFQGAVSVPGAERWPFDLARIQLAYGTYLRRSGEVEKAREQLTSSLETMRTLEAWPWADRASDLLRATGEVVPGTRRIAKPLTAVEQRIALLAASGLTNAEIAARVKLSARTIGGHLYRVFQKLGVVSRAQLRDALPHD